MENRFKLIISNNKMYKEVELSSDFDGIKVGTTSNCEVRLKKELFFESFEISLNFEENQWVISCSDNIYLTVDGVRKVLNKNLIHGDEFSFKYQNSDNILFNAFYMIDFEYETKNYERVINIENKSSITIGGLANCDIVINDKFVGKDSFTLNLNNKGMYDLVDNNSKYGVYVNGQKINKTAIVGSMDFISIASYSFYIKDNKIYTSKSKEITTILNFTDTCEQKSWHKYPKFNRSTRINNIVSNEKIDVLDPPAIIQKQKNNILTRLLPSMGILVAGGAMAFFGGAMIIMAAISGVMAIITTIVTLKESNKEYRKNCEDRIQKYNNYISNKRKEITSIRNNEKDVLDKIYISQEKEQKLFEDFSPNLFDRTPSDNDFLAVKLGNGNVVAQRKVEYKKQEKLEIEDELQLMPFNLSNEYKFINDAPVVCEFKEVNAVGIVGENENRYNIFKNIIVDLLARQSFNDFKMIFVSESKNADKIDWLRMLPHVNDDNYKLKTIVTDDESKNIVFEYLYKELTFRQQTKKHNEHIIVFFIDEYSFKSHPISKFVKNGKDLGITFVFFGDGISDIPIGCNKIISLFEENKGTLLDVENESDFIEFNYTSFSTEYIKKIVELLAPVYTEEISLEGTLTKSISMFELLNIIAIEDIDLGERWKSSMVYKSMAAPIGVSKGGTILLDLHDKAHGPHGLVAGTTGSGKSEILQTYILSMATLYHPYEVGFVIIDFKGGGMVNQFKELPHLLGAITNIDGKEIDRSLKSIKAELQKRQRLFAEADVNHIDKYIKKFKACELETPLPHLILIVDEFAELKAEQPEFMKELISAARIGRSLGVHLILATQKPSGQVNEQIWSNSRFKLCLKVQSQEDSNEVIKSPLAAEIKEPGRAYLQVGNNEIFELFQSAYGGAPEKLDDTALKEFTINNVSVCGRRIPVYNQKRKQVEGENYTQLDSIVNYVTLYCSNNKVKRLSNICLPPLVDYLTIPEIIDEYSLYALPLGIYDDPDSQYQGYANFNLCDENTIIIGSSQTGKTNLIQNIIKLVAYRCSPKEAVFYISDFGAMYLKNFETLNHIGGVVTISEGEKFKNLFKLLIEEIQNRKSKFLECGLSSYSTYREAGYGDLPHIFFVIDNFSAFKEVYADEYEDQFIYLTREGLSCGVSIIVTNGGTNGLGYRYMSNFACRIALKCNDSSEYMNIFDRCRIQPKDVPGRVLCKLNKELYEMQSFIAFEGEKEIDRSNEVKKFIEQTNLRYTNEKAKTIPSIPETLTFDYIDKNYTNQIKGYKYPIALDYANVDVVLLDLKVQNEVCVIGRSSDKRLKATNSILSSIHHNILSKPVELYIIDDVERKLKHYSENSYVERYTIDYTEIGTIFDNLMPELEKRHQLLMDGELDKLEKCSQLIILINNKDALDYLSSSKELFEDYMRIIKQYKALLIAFVFTDIEDATVGYSGPELLKRFKETKKAIITSNLQEFKFCDLPSNAVRANKTTNVGDAFLLDGSDLTRIKLAEGTKK